MSNQQRKFPTIASKMVETTFLVLLSFLAFSGVHATQSYCQAVQAINDTTCHTCVEISILQGLPNVSYQTQKELGIEKSFQRQKILSFFFHPFFSSFVLLKNNSAFLCPATHLRLSLFFLSLFFCKINYSYLCILVIYQDVRIVIHPLRAFFCQAHSSSSNSSPSSAPIARILTLEKRTVQTHFILLLLMFRASLCMHAGRTPIVL